MSVRAVLTIDSVLLCMSKEQTIAGRVPALFYCCPALHFTTFCIIIILFDRNVNKKITPDSFTLL